MSREKSSRLIDHLLAGRKLSKEEFLTLLMDNSEETKQLVFQAARKQQQFHYGNQVFIRGLIECTNYCRNDCYYCGIRSSNRNAARYRLSDEDILYSCKKGYEVGFCTFVLQGGEDPLWTDERVVPLIDKIKKKYPDCALTLSLGERKKDSYQAFYDAGADRYLLRHETANACHYRRLHPDRLSLEHRKQCLWNLKEIGFQVGTGIMVGSPFQKTEDLAEDLLFIQELQPHMVGIGPFISHRDTPFADCPNGSFYMTLYLLGILRIVLPKALIPATTALASIHLEGREQGILAGANVVMPNLSPTAVRQKYMLYNNKINSGLESREGLKDLEERMASIGYQIISERGDCKEYIRKQGYHVSKKFIKS